MLAGIHISNLPNLTECSASKGFSLRLPDPLRSGRSMDPGDRPGWYISRQVVEDGASLAGVVFSTVDNALSYEVLAITPEYSESVQFARLSAEPEFQIGVGIHDDAAGNTAWFERYSCRPEELGGLHGRSIVEHNFSVIVVDLKRAMNPRDTWSINCDVTSAPESRQRSA